MATRGRPPKPLEEKRRLGNPGGRRLPAQGELVALPPSPEPPAPHRPLGRVGREMWDRVWTAGVPWLSAMTDAEALQLVCEQVDERVEVRLRVLQTGDWRQRAALRALDAQILAGLQALGFTPVDRTRMGVAEVARVSKLESLRRQA